MAPPEELAVVGSPLEVPSSQGSTAAITPVDRIREPTNCTLVVLIGRQNTMMEVATGVAHPPGGLHHNNRIPPDYTRVEVHTVMPEFIQWKIDHVTPEGIELLREVMNQFILWHKRDIILRLLVRRLWHYSYIWRELLRRGRYMTTTCLRCHGLHCLIPSRCHNLHRLIASMCMRCHSPHRLVASMCMTCHNPHRLIVSTCMMKWHNLHYKQK